MFERLKNHRSEQKSNSQEGSTEWDSLAGAPSAIDQPSTNANTVTFESLERERAERHKQNQENKVVRILSGESEELLNQRGDIPVNPGVRENVVEMIADGKITTADEIRLLESIAAPADVSRDGVNVVAYKIVGNRHERKILSYMTGLSDERFDSSYVSNFMTRYPTPLDFEGAKTSFLQMIKDNNSAEKFKEYDHDMEAFCSHVYGKRQEYYERIKQLNIEANELYERRQEESERAQVQYEAMEQMNKSPFKDIGGGILSKALVRGEQNGAPSEDGAYYDAENGIMAVFDGVGGMQGGADASSACVNMLPLFMSEADFSNPVDRIEVARRLNDQVPNGSATTCVITKTEKNADGTSTLHYISIGDSRLYVVRSNVAYQINKDDSPTNEMLDANGITDYNKRKYLLQHGITRSLGGTFSGPSADNNGSIKLYPGDRILLCSDGITGDLTEDNLDDEDRANGLRPNNMTNTEIANLISLSANCQDAAQNLIYYAKKTDDRTALVAEI